MAQERPRRAGFPPPRTAPTLDRAGRPVRVGAIIVELAGPPVRGRVVAAHDGVLLYAALPGQRLVNAAGGRTSYPTGWR